MRVGAARQTASPRVRRTGPWPVRRGRRLAGNGTAEIMARRRTAARVERVELGAGFGSRGDRDRIFVQDAELQSVVSALNRADCMPVWVRQIGASRR